MTQYAKQALWKNYGDFRMGWSMQGIKKLEVEMDALAAVQLVDGTNTTHHPLSSILSDCRFHVGKFEELKLKHI